jgi:murein DD-endopeptidase MepM/ murein hydrolase activator NlpD
LPDDDEGAPESESYMGAHHDPDGRWVAYDQIPRRPDRPADYDVFRYPVPCHPGCVVSGYDLDRPDELQRRGRRMRHVGHGAIDILQPRGTPVTLLALEHQQGDADVVYVGPLFGTSVVTHHVIREAGGLRDYLLVFGHLAAPAPTLSEQSAGTRLREGDVVGFVGDTASPGLVHLHMEVRRLREGVELKNLGPARLVDNAISIVCDPRNVLPLK